MIIMKQRGKIKRWLALVRNKKSSPSAPVTTNFSVLEGQTIEVPVSPSGSGSFDVSVSLSLPSGHTKGWVKCLVQINGKCNFSAAGPEGLVTALMTINQPGVVSNASVVIYDATQEQIQTVSILECLVSGPSATLTLTVNWTSSLNGSFSAVNLNVSLSPIVLVSWT